MIEGAGAAQVETWEVTNTRTGNVSCTIKRIQPLKDCTDTAALSGENTYSFRGLWSGGSSEPRTWGMDTLDETRKIVFCFNAIGCYLHQNNGFKYIPFDLFLVL